MLNISFDPFPVLETNRLVLRRIDKHDAPAIFRLRSDAKAMKYVPRPLAKSIDDAMEHIANIDAKLETNEGINWAISRKGIHDFIGIIGHFRIIPEHYRAEVGYMLLPEYHGQGIVSEALERVVGYGFDQMKLHSIEAIIDPENIASARVLEKNSFLKEAHFKENEFYDGRFLDTVIYSIVSPLPFAKE
jgi:ribosomal-protein-alanine N-acetyltransferase